MQINHVGAPAHRCPEEEKDENEHTEKNNDYNNC